MFFCPNKNMKQIYIFAKFVCFSSIQKFLAFNACMRKLFLDVVYNAAHVAHVIQTCKKRSKNKNAHHMYLWIIILLNANRNFWFFGHPYDRIHSTPNNNDVFEIFCSLLHIVLIWIDVGVNKNITCALSQCLLQITWIIYGLIHGLSRKFIQLSYY